MSAEVIRPKVLIIGAGLGGLTLGAILERADIPYEIFERASALRPLGSAISMGPGVMPLFVQLGLMDQIKAKGKVAKIGHLSNEKMEVLARLDFFSGVVEWFGWPTYIIARPTLHHMLLDLIPPEKVHLGQRVVSQTDTDDGVTIETAEGETHHGHILVGADGAYSGVRQLLYRRLAKEGVLPISDKEPLKYSMVCLVGQTRPLDKATFAHIDDEDCIVEYVLADKKPLFFVLFTTAEKTVCWMVLEMLDKKLSNDGDDHRASEWGPEAAEAMCNEIRLLPIRKNMKLGDLIDLTPKEVICKVKLEEKIFQTWTHGRTVLLGDACHKMAPNAGLGGQSAMFDAIVLGNYLHTLTTSNLKDIQEALRAYTNERYPLGKDAVAVSAFAKNLIKQNFAGMLIRKALKHFPSWLYLRISARTMAYRPQISFLPPVEDKGTCQTTFQPSLARTRPRFLAAML